MKVNNQINISNTTQNEQIMLFPQLNVNDEKSNCIPTEIQNISMSDGVKEAVEILTDNEIEVDASTMKDIKAFIEKIPGDIKSKLETIRILASKGSKITLKGLTAAYSALNGIDLGKLLNKIISEIGNLTLDGRLTKILELTDIKPKAEISDDNHSSNLKNEMYVKEYLKEVIDEVFDIYEGKELNNEPDLESDKISIEDKITNEIVHESNVIDNFDAYQLPSLMTTEINSKNMLVIEVTEKLVKMKAYFKETKRELLNSIDKAITEPINRKQNLEKAIDLLDRAILKSDITLYTDMKLEKQLIQSSSELEIARQYVIGGNMDKAMEIVKNVKALLDNIDWKPSKSKVFNIMSQMPIGDQMDLTQKLAKSISQLVTGKSNQPSAKSVFENLRTQGLNHESEVVQMLESNSREYDNETIQDNIKSIISKLIEGKSSSESQNFITALEQVASNILGQQHLNKNNSSQNLQTLFLNVPLTIAGEVENVKIYINAKKDREKVDWQNCNLYFHFETRKLGETGVLVSAVNRNLTLTVKNNNSSVERKFSEFTGVLKEDLQQIGYNVGNIGFGRLNEDSKPMQDDNVNSKAQPINQNALKGFDIKI